MVINYSDQDVVKGSKSIFLAGPTPRKENIESWRKKACQILEDKGFDGIVYVPEYSSWKPLESYDDQVMWEREALSNASIIVFWVPRRIPDMEGYTTNVEFGYWLHKGNVLYGRPDDAEKTKYLDWLYEFDYNREPINDLDNLLGNALMNINNKSYTLKRRK